MAYIDPEGMFGGDRMALLSDSARFAWPWFWCAHNTVGRVELNYRVFCDTVFRQFKKKPTETQFWEWVSEFHECYLMYAYQSEGTIWGQWDVSEQYLPRYKTKADQKTPVPTAREYIEWQKEYLNAKENKVAGKCRVLNVRGNLPKVSGNLPVSIGVGVVVGVGEITNTNAADAAGVLPFPELPKEPTLDELLGEAAQRMVLRHPQNRTCSVPQAKGRLKSIVEQAPKAQRRERLRWIEANHATWCDSEQWTKDGCEFAKGLHNWLKLADKLFDLLPPARASPKEQPYKYKPDLERMVTPETIAAERKRRGLDADGIEPAG